MLLTHMLVTSPDGSLQSVGTIRIINTGDDDSGLRDYAIRLDSLEGTQQASVERFDPSKGAWALLSEAIKALEREV